MILGIDLFKYKKTVTAGNKVLFLSMSKPRPRYLDNVKKLDNFLRDILKEERKTNEQNIENVLEKLQRKTVDVMEF